MTKEDFVKLVNSHDLTYGYSDDPNAYRRGRDSYIAICSAAKHFDEVWVNEVWNTMVLSKVRAEYAGSFLNLLK
jgi:hypothetical protein